MSARPKLGSFRTISPRGSGRPVEIGFVSHDRLHAWSHRRRRELGLFGAIALGSSWVGRSFGKLRTGSRPTPSRGKLALFGAMGPAGPSAPGGKLGSFCIFPPPGTSPCPSRGQIGFVSHDWLRPIGFVCTAGPATPGAGAQAFLNPQSPMLSPPAATGGRNPQSRNWVRFAHFALRSRSRAIPRKELGIPFTGRLVGIPSSRGVPARAGLGGCGPQPIGPIGFVLHNRARVLTSLPSAFKS